jgi:hypothetical protein
MCSRLPKVIEMSGLIDSQPMEVRASPRTSSKRDTSDKCRERATEDLLKSVTMLTANQRMILERSAASWTERAQLLDRVEGVARVARGNQGSAPEGLRA